MSILNKIKKRSLRRKLRVKSKIRLDYRNNKIRISVFRSLKNFYAQAIDDTKKITLSSVYSGEFKESEKKTKKEISFEIGKIFADKLKTINIEEAIFDRGMYLYHGRIQSFVEGLRAGGLKI